MAEWLTATNLSFITPPKIPIGLYHCPWFIFSLHCIAFHFLSSIVLFCCTVHCCLFSFLIFSLLATSSINWIWIWMDIDVEAFNLSLMISDIHSLLVTHIRFSCLHCLRYRKMFERVSLILLLLDSQWNYLQQQILSEDCFSTSCCPVKCLK